MYNDKGKLHIEKGFFTFEDFMNAYQEHEDKQAVLHFRIRTHGNIDKENCHPYQVDDNLAFVHNGTISSVTTTDISKSDTWHFNEQILKPIRKRYKAFFKDDLYTTLIDSYIGWSKLIFLNSKGEFSIVNAKAGEWNAGCWLSNGSWKVTKSKPVVNLPVRTTYELEEDTGTWHYRNAKQLEREQLSAGNICWVTSDTQGLKTGDYVKVKYIYADNTVGVMNCKGDQVFEYRVGVYHLSKTSLPDLEDTYKDVEVTPTVAKPPLFDPTDIVLFTKNWNHFRKDDEVSVVKMSDDNKSCIIEDDATFKHYIVPIEFLEYTGYKLDDDFWRAF